MYIIQFVNKKISAAFKRQKNGYNYGTNYVNILFNLIGKEFSWCEWLERSITVLGVVGSSLLTALQRYDGLNSPTHNC